MSLKTLLSRFKPVTYHIKKPHIPDYVLATDPTIDIPSLFGIAGSYRPKTGEMTLSYDSVTTKGILQNNTLTIDTPKSKQFETDHYLNWRVLNENSIAEAFIDANASPVGGYSVAAKLMISSLDNQSEDISNKVLYSLENLPNGTTPLGRHSLIRSDDTFIILTTHTILVLKRDKDLGIPHYTITHDTMSVKTFEALDECYEVGQALQALSNKYIKSLHN